MTSELDDILGAAKGKGKKSPPPPARSEPTSPPPPSPWDELKPVNREATTRLNVDIAVSLNDQLANKARALGIPKTELVRKLLEWAITQASE